MSEKPKRPILLAPPRRKQLPTLSASPRVKVPLPAPVAIRAPAPAAPTPAAAAPIPAQAPASAAVDVGQAFSWTDWDAAEDKLTYAARLSVPDLAGLVSNLAKAYYGGEALVSDALFDSIQEVLSLLVPDHPVLQQVGAEVGAEAPRTGNIRFDPENYPQLAGKIYQNPLWRQKIPLPFLMPSMDKVKPKDISKWGNWTASNPGPYNISDKVDGMSAGLIYRIDPAARLTVQLTSRGDGEIGEDLSAILPYLRVPGGALPLSANLETLIRSAPGANVQVRGEIIIPRERFEKAIGKGFALRNVARGIIGGKTLRSGLIDLVDFVAYELVHPWPQSLTQGLDMLGGLGFTVVHNVREANDRTLSLEDLRQMLLLRKAASPYEIDGLIVTQDALPSRSIQKGDSFPDYAMAFKFDTDSDDTESALSIVRDVVWNRSKDGKLNPVAVIKPVGVGGVNIENVTMHNARYVTDMGIGPGAIVRVTRGGDVIPQIVASLRPVAPKMPAIPYQWNETGRSISLLDPDLNPEVMLSRVQFFFKKLGVPNWGDANVQKIVERNLPMPTDLLNVLDMTVEDLETLPGFQRKMAEKLYSSLHDKLERTNLPSLMAASNLFGAGFGERRFQALFKDMPDFLRKPFRTEADRQRLLQEIVAIPGFQTKTGSLLVKGLPYFIPFLYGIYRAGWISVVLPRPGVGAPVDIFPDATPKGSERSLGDAADDALDDLRATGRHDYDQEDYDKSTYLQTALFSAIDAETAAKKAVSARRPVLGGPPRLRVPAGSSSATSAVASGAAAAAATSGAAAGAGAAKPSLAGKVIVFTGVHKGLEDDATNRGAVVRKSVSGTTDILVKKDDTWTSSKVTKAEGQPGTKIMTVDEFRQTFL